ncbi:MAG: hypothetical protein A4E69_00314 [Syntrophus sp. PtaB.Bin138]|nr:MAG: hypothetical protein A4E69_00314 [Syntrophus sp. PtaB.Bin138]
MRRGGFGLIQGRDFLLGQILAVGVKDFSLGVGQGAAHAQGLSGVFHHPGKLFLLLADGGFLLPGLNRRGIGLTFLLLSVEQFDPLCGQAFADLEKIDGLGAGWGIDGVGVGAGGIDRHAQFFSDGGHDLPFREPQHFVDQSLLAHVITGQGGFQGGLLGLGVCDGGGRAGLFLGGDPGGFLLPAGDFRLTGGFELLLFGEIFVQNGIKEGGAFDLVFRLLLFIEDGLPLRFRDLRFLLNRAGGHGTGVVHRTGRRGCFLLQTQSSINLCLGAFCLFPDDARFRGKGRFDSSTFAVKDVACHILRVHFGQDGASLIFRKIPVGFFLSGPGFLNALLDAGGDFLVR